MVFNVKLRFIFSCLFLYLFTTNSAFPQSTNPPGNQWPLIIGTQEGLVAVDQSGKSTFLWSGGAVNKIMNRSTGNGLGWVILSAEGILVSDDLKNWEYRNDGLPVMTIKVYDGTASLTTELQEIKDLEIDPQNPEIMVCAVKDAVYLTRNGGRNWENLGMPNYRTNGTKAVAVTTMGDELIVFYTHSIYGLYYYTPSRPRAGWVELNTGIEKHETTDNPDELSDIIIRLLPGRDPEVIVSQTFRKRIFRLDWEQKKFDLLWSGGPGFGIIDSLSLSGNTLRFIQDNETLEFDIPESGTVQLTAIRQRHDLMEIVNSIPVNLDLYPNCIMIPGTAEYTGLSELWLLLDKSAVVSTRNQSLIQDEQKLPAGANREGIYLPVNHAMDPHSLAPYMELIKSRNLNMVTIDMKDDYGRLRFTPQNTPINNWGRVFRPVDLEAFLKTMKDAGIYTVARIVVFKDPEVAARSSGKYAVWDKAGNIPWEGYYDTRQKKTIAGNVSSNYKTEILPADDPEWEILRTYYDERWVDPYCEEFWEYIATVSEELCQRGFDEIQFDYIRFPTDGYNLGDAQYRWQSAGMSMDSAIISFLRHVRGRVKAPISVDIYGANGWYRTGARTGQDVELLIHWVDIICPMYYPSHFEQHFLAQSPPEMRPYRIYYTGTMRTHFIARGKTIVRPWVQAFYLNVSYDRQYYNTDYIQREIDGTRDAGTGGFTYWNNLGRYDDIPMP